MSQNLSTGVADPPIITSNEAQYDTRHDPSNLDATTDTNKTLETAAARMNLESFTNPVLENLSPSDKEEPKIPDDSPEPDPVLHENPNVNNARESIIPAATTGGNGGAVSSETSNSVAPPISIVRPLKNITSSTEPEPSISATATKTTISPNIEQNQASIASDSAKPQASSDNATAANSIIIPNEAMDVVRAKRNRRKMARVNAHPNALTVYEAELTSKDRAIQKEAVRQYLEKRVKQDWNWVWPSKETAPIDIMEALVKDPSVDSHPNTSTDSPRYKEEWRERDVWESDPSESESEIPTSPKGPININSPDKESSFRFENPDGVGEVVKQRRAARRRRHKKKLAAEMEWNTGVQCYTERRDAWTCARHVPPPTGREPRGIENMKSQANGILHKTVDDFSDSEGWDTEVPIAKSLLPPDNAMRASITPQAYSTIYDKVILQSLKPSCPINLSDVIQSCVQGWKRDGEWPPTSSVPEPSLVAKKKQRRLSVLNILGLNQPQIPETKVASPAAEKSPQAQSAIKKGLQKFWKRGDKDKGTPEGGTAA
ncbi:hypothetical protein EYC80_004608 [Monilinia laxa]|uniref:Gag1-like clamp domain-containing protein n=1 Tax=Monilinia laxa TaxID=61186 RepID=A0A5N6KH99_MONLA|nr:hypothetical protein EYC80_004608 [Monilinia laxa]